MQINKKQAQGKKQVGRWAPDEHERFMAAIATYGKDWKKVQQLVGTRSGSQVRSHAQKFFNKLLKQQSQRKGSDSKAGKQGQLPFQGEHDHQKDHQIQQSQNSFLKLIHDDGSNTTPIQLVSLIKGQMQHNNQKKVDIKKFQKRLKQKMEQNQPIIRQQPENAEQQNILALGKLQRQNSFKSMNNILQAYETVKDPSKNQMENQSFLMGLTRHYKKYFSKGGRFENLIDFGNPVEVQNFQKSIRKRSFTLPQGVQGDEEDLNQRKKRVITEQKTAKMSTKEVQSFKEAIKKMENENKLKQHKDQNQKQKQQQQNQKDKSQKRDQINSKIQRPQDDSPKKSGNGTAKQKIQKN